MQSETETTNNREPLNPKQNTLDKEGRIRPDWLFSYWIFTWFIIYMLTKGAIKESPGSKYIYENMNPLYVYYIAFIENVLTLMYYIFSGANSSVISKYTLMILLMKGIPIYFLRREKTNLQINLLWFIIIFA